MESQYQEPTELLSGSDDEDGKEMQSSDSSSVSPLAGKKKPFNPQIWPPVESDDEILDQDRKYKLDFARNLRCEEELEEVPDLAGYLGVFGLTEFQQIALCRTYANYLSQRSRVRVSASATAGKGIKRNKVSK